MKWFKENKGLIFCGNISKCFTENKAPVLIVIKWSWEKRRLGVSGDTVAV